jgi:hypothetical protein
MKSFPLLPLSHPSFINRIKSNTKTQSRLTLFPFRRVNWTTKKSPESTAEIFIYAWADWLRTGVAFGGETEVLC